MNKFSLLRNRLQDSGWAISISEIPIDAWWAFEIWMLKSTWRPVGKVIYVSLMLDPQDTFYENNPQDTDVWCAALSHDFPTGRIGDVNHEFSVRRKYKQRVEEIIEVANKMRTP